MAYYLDAERLTFDQVRDLQGLDDSEVERLKKRDDVLRWQRGGQLEFPALQFDPLRRRVHPATSEIMKNRPPKWSSLRVLIGLMQLHRSFGATPAEMLGQADQEVVAAFQRASEPPLHG
ncbi:hypothetical protein [Histidinibacterium aquaticum]|uniref:Uncharacterized protein n=1 Tax=Histidinibacterium aquaticum TaxID=2613962 RepID=A0A5J5GJT1_9RHOB|nr:hypothetical protein [Histidinibacterium aquaticum]KAA9007784.1 hypothetical protein F3S47_09650 [Histidinibacterium aquaticum]